MKKNYRCKPYRKAKFNCPECAGRKKYTRFIDTITDELLPEEFGMCDRESRCGYKKFPTDYVAGLTERQAPEEIEDEETETWYIPKGLLLNSMQDYSQNTLAAYLQNLVGPELTSKAFSDYYVGTSHRWPERAVLWLVDTSGRIVSGQIMAFNPDGHRSKEIAPTWVHKQLNYPEDSTAKRLYGEHLLRKYPDLPVAVCESPKTALIASIYLPRFVWLAAGSLTWLTKKRCKVLKGRRVILFPDLGGYDLWKRKADQFGFEVNDLLERKATELDYQEQLDIADYLIKFPVEKFRPSPIQQFKKEIIREAETTGFANCDYWAERLQISPEGALEAVYQVAEENDYDIEPPALDEQSEFEKSLCFKSSDIQFFSF